MYTHMTSTVHPSTTAVYLTPAYMPLPQVDRLVSHGAELFQSVSLSRDRADHATVVDYAHQQLTRVRDGAHRIYPHVVCVCRFTVELYIYNMHVIQSHDQSHDWSCDWSRGWSCDWLCDTHPVVIHILQLMYIHLPPPGEAHQGLPP